MKNIISLTIISSLISCQTKTIYPLQQQNIEDIVGIIYLWEGSSYVLKDKKKIQHLQKLNLYFKDKITFTRPKEGMVIINNPRTNDIYNTLEYYYAPTSFPMTIEGMSKIDWLSYFTECTVEVYPSKTEGVSPFLTYSVEETSVYFYAKHLDNNNN